MKHSPTDGVERGSRQYSQQFARPPGQRHATDRHTTQTVLCVCRDQRNSDNHQLDNVTVSSVPPYRRHHRQYNTSSYQSSDHHVVVTIAARKRTGTRWFRTKLGVVFCGWKFGQCWKFIILITITGIKMAAALKTHRRRVLLVLFLTGLERSRVSAYYNDGKYLCLYTVLSFAQFLEFRIYG